MTPNVIICTQCGRTIDLDNEADLVSPIPDEPLCVFCQNYGANNDF